MSRSGRSSSRALRSGLNVRRTPLPLITAQEKRAFLASLNDPVEGEAEIILEIPIPDDILSIEGKKRWDMQRIAAVETVGIETIQNNTLVQPYTYYHQPVKENIFEALDQKMMDSERIADKIKKDFEELGIAAPEGKVKVESLYSNKPTKARVYYDKQTERNHEDINKSDLVIFNSDYKNKLSAERKRALKTIDIAESKLYSCSASHKSKTSGKDSSRRYYNAVNRGVEWDRVNEYVQYD